jgi:hypothetical protein
MVFPDGETVFRRVRLGTPAMQNVAGDEWIAVPR